MLTTRYFSYGGTEAFTISVIAMYDIISDYQEKDNGFYLLERGNTLRDKSAICVT
jgi:hypothetical protein